jgi:plastocyanin
MLNSIYHFTNTWKEDTMRRPLTIALLAFCAASLTFAGDLVGKVSFEGTPPKEPRINMNADPICTRAHKGPVFSEEVEVNKNGTLKNVLVYVKDGLGNKKFSPPSEKVEFDQVGCMYHPHVLGIQAGQELVVKNGDPTLHNVHSLSKENDQFNIAQPKKGMQFSKKFDKLETFKVKCEVHSWMNAWITVLNNPFFAVTGDDGTFDLKKLPAGDYTIEAWHEKYGIQTMKVKVPAKGEATVDFKFAAK